jgi:XTP/dITP diphosphohydrolase
MSKKLLFITSNQNKLEEFKAITGLDVDSCQLDIPEIQSMDVEEVAKAKAISAFKITGSPVIVDDTGMSIDSLNGLPGAFITWFLERLGPEGILDLLIEKHNRKASVSTCIAYADEKGVHTFVGTVPGTISNNSRGENGFGYDTIFIPDGHDKTYAEMSNEEKNEISMRKIALLKFREFMQQKK